MHGSKLTWKLLWFLSAATVLLLYVVHVYFGEVNQDEGWYLYGARLVHEGRHPYIDFATTQGPVLFRVYGLLWPLYGASGVLGGRWLTAVFGLSSLVLTAGVAARIAGRSGRCAVAPAAFLAFSLAGVNVYQAYFFSVVKTYALCALLLMAAFSVLLRQRRAGLRYFVVGLLMAFAVMTRLSAAGMAGGVGLVLFVQSFRDRLALKCLLFYVAGGVVCVGFVLAPYLFVAGEAVGFAFFDYHAGRVAGSLFAALAYKAGFMSRMLSAYFVVFALLLVYIITCVTRRMATPRGIRRATTEKSRADPVMPMLWLGVLFTTAIHWLAPFPYDDYQVIVFPAFAVAVAVALVRLGSERLFNRAGGALACCISVFLLCLAAAFASPRNQELMVGKRDRIWWPLRDETSLGKLQRVGRTLGRLAAEHSETVLLTQDTYLAVEAGLYVPQGLELGPFAYFPDWPDHIARTIGVLNQEGLLELIRSSQARYAAFSEYGFSIRSPDVAPVDEAERADLLQALLNRYELLFSEENFGQAMTRLNVYELKSSRPDKPDGPVMDEEPRRLQR